MAEKWPRDLWLDAIWDDESLKPAERVVAYAFARYAFEKDTTWCAWAEITRRTGIKSKDTIWRTIRSLIASGWLVEIEPARQHRSAVYQLTAPVDARPVDNSPEVRFPDPWDRPEVPEVRNLGARGPIFRNQGSDFYEPRTQIENSQENSHTRVKPARVPSDTRVSRKCDRCNGRGWQTLGIGQMEPCPCVSEAAA